jgi:hypothetical protein
MSRTDILEETSLCNITTRQPDEKNPHRRISVDGRKH